METMTPWERMSAVLAGEGTDRPAVSFWHHFTPNEAQGRAAIDAHLRHLDSFGIDFLKVMNDNPYPWTVGDGTVSELRDLPALEGTEEGFSKQIELIRALGAKLNGKVLMSTTLFNAWAVLRRLVASEGGKRHGPPTLHGGPTPVDLRISALLAEDRSAVATAINVISESLAKFARRCVDAGADGVFLSVRDDWVNTEANGLDTYREIVRDGDLKILEAVSDARFNMLHVCGVPGDFDAFAEYPVSIINWADREGGPAIRDVINRIKPIVCGGVDNLGTLPNGSPRDVEHEVRDALEQAGGKAMIVSAGCTYDPDSVPSANLEAMVRAARNS